MRSENPESQTHHEGSGMLRWLLTYADMITLLLAFFIVLYSIAKVDQAKYQQLANELSFIFNGRSGILNSGHNPIASDGPSDASMTRLFELLQNYTNTRQGNLIIEVTDERITLRIPEALLFRTGDASLTPQALEILRGISGILSDFPNEIRVEGFTDDVPISNARFPSNWHLSAARAASVALYLTENQIDPRRVTAAGYGEYRPMVPNDTAEHRQLNRRVDIVILSEE